MPDPIAPAAAQARFPELLGQLPLAEVEAVLAATEVGTLAAGRTLVDPSSPGCALYLLWSGTLRVEVGPPDAPVLVLHLEPGAHCGDVSFIDSGPPTAAVLAETDCVLISLSQGAFDGLVRSHPRAARALLHRLCEDLTARVRQTSAELLAHQGVRSRPLFAR
jgi:CRP-like cAMP-binding protein